MLDKLKERMAHIRDAAQNTAAGMIEVKVSDEIQQYRYGICQSCEKLYRPTDTCKVCGCFMKVKTWMPAQACPLRKWSAAEPEQKQD